MTLSIFLKENHSDFIPYSPNSVHLTAAQSKALDADYVKKGGDIETLMETAGFRVASFTEAILRTEATQNKISKNEQNILIVAGKGNNGGDALVSARYLVQWGYQVTILVNKALSQQKTPSLSKTMLDRTEAMEKNTDASYMIKHHYSNEGSEKEELAPLFTDCDVIIDGILGVGIQGAPRPEHARLIQLMNNSPGQVIAIDCPSGFNCDHGHDVGADDKHDNKYYNEQIKHDCVKAEYTLSLGYAKQGFLDMEACQRFCGLVFLVDIGV